MSDVRLQTVYDEGQIHVVVIISSKKSVMLQCS